MVQRRKNTKSRQHNLILSKNYETLPVKLSLDDRTEALLKALMLITSFPQSSTIPVRTNISRTLRMLSRRHFWTCPYTSYYILGARIVLLSDAFVGLNQGKPMNAMEKRNAIFTPVSDACPPTTRGVPLYTRGPFGYNQENERLGYGAKDHLPCTLQSKRGEL